MALLKILHVIPNLSKGGAERLVLDICNELQKREQVKVKLLLLEDKNDYKFLSNDIDIEVCKVTFELSIFKKNNIHLEKFESIIDKFQPDVIHSHLYAAEIISHENIRKNVIYFSHCHDNMSQFRKLNVSTFFSKNKITNYYERLRLFKRYHEADNQFIAISKDTKLFLQQTLPNHLSNKIHHLTNAINVSAFHKPNYQAPGIEIKLINIGSLVDKKNQQFLVKVVKYLKNAGHKVHLKLIGDGINRTALIKEIETLDLSNEIVLLGKIDDVQKELWASDIYVHSAYYEPFGLVLVEAMAAGLPIVCLDGRGNTEIVESGKNGFLVKQNDAKKFSEKILEIFFNKELHQTMSDHSKQLSEKYSIDKYVNQLLNLYKSSI